MKALVQDRLGLPADVVQLRDIPTPEPGPGQTLVRVLAAAVHPGDAFFTQGLYPEARRPHLPGQVVGNHAVGRVADDRSRLPLGSLVAFSARDAWAEYAAVDTAALIAIEESLPIERAVQLMPAITACDVLSASGVAAGDWLAVTAAHSLVSGLVIQMARRRGVRVVALCRQRIPGRDLEALGAETVIALRGQEHTLAEAVRTATGGAGPDAVIDAVGGAVLAQLTGAMAYGGKAVIVGAYDAQPSPVSAQSLLMNRHEIRSYIYRYFLDAPSPEDAGFLASVLGELAEPSLDVLTAGWHPVEDYRTALAEAARRPEAGKRIMDFS